MFHYFISDLHLEKENTTTASAFFSFIEENRNSMESLYILGDFFEYWVGDDYRDELVNKIITTLKGLSAHCPIYFIAGNRDFLLAQKFADLCGMKIIADESVVTIAGEKIVLMHGDSLCTDDTEYQQFKVLSRSAPWQEAMLSQPLDARIAIAQDMRKKSIASQSNKAGNIMDVNDEAVLATFARNNSKTLIHGHTHRPQIHSYENACYRYVLGDWGDTAQILKIAANDPAEKTLLTITF